VRMGHPPIRIELMNEIDGVTVSVRQIHSCQGL
jgi:hypothetical protein